MVARASRSAPSRGTDRPTPVRISRQSAASWPADALEHGAVLRVHRHHLAAARPRRLGHQLARHHQRLLVGQRHPLARRAARPAWRRDRRRPPPRSPRCRRSGWSAASTSTSGPDGQRRIRPPLRETGERRPPFGTAAPRSSSALRPAVSATTRKCSRWRRSTASVLRPIDPVEPRIATPRISALPAGGTAPPRRGPRSRASRSGRARRRGPG